MNEVQRGPEERQEEHHDVHDDQRASMAAWRTDSRCFHSRGHPRPGRSEPKMVAPTEMNTTKHDSLVVVLRELVSAELIDRRPRNDGAMMAPARHRAAFW